MKKAVEKTDTEVTEAKRVEQSLRIVAIGASAGGLEAITQLLKSLPDKTGMAYIYVQHLSPDHKSILTSILSKLTPMPLQEVKDKMRMYADNLYVIPPGKEMLVIDGHIKLIPRVKGKIVSLPIDAFFTSLADKHKENAIGIILSGNASDGTLGLGAIKAAGGLTFAQNSSAKFGSMPESAIAAGAVDFVLSPADIATELAQLSKGHFVRHHTFHVGKENEISNSDSSLKVIIDLLHKETGVDFSHYKMPTIKRRILRRMLLYKIQSLKDYAELIAVKSDEVNILYQDLLINVTCFFRDTEVHQYLTTTLLPRLLKSKAAEETLRIWIPACSTGEEAYSIAMAILDLQRGTEGRTNVQIFSSDLSKHAITKARAGEYNASQVEGVSADMLQRYYTKVGNNYRIARPVRDMCVFAQHNVLRDPPFSRVDIISCCNLLIYLDAAAQKKAIGTFHYALKDGGYLILGKSETTGASAHLFTRVSNKLKIYSRKNSTGPRKLPELIPRVYNTPHQEIISHIIPQKMASALKNSFDSELDAILLANYMPAGVVVNHAMDILQFRGATGLFLKHATCRASLNILKMALPEIAFELRTAISTVVREQRTVIKSGIDIKSDGIMRVISIEVAPLAMEWDEPLILILFTESERHESLTQQEKGTKASLAKDKRIKKLEDELTAIRADMHNFTREQEAFNEELQSANEEVVSSNEELQSVNEELETSKEEIESSNEELITTNQELQTRNDMLNESYDYSEAIIATIHEPMVILDKELRVKSANKSFYKNFKVKEKDTEGALLSELGNEQWNIPRLIAHLDEVVQKNTHFTNFEVIHTFPVIGEKIMLLNASRIVQKKHNVQLILLAIQDVTEVRLKTIALREKEKELSKKNAAELKAEKIKLEHAVEERTIELAQANADLIFQNGEKEKRGAELIIANKELFAQNQMKEKLALELIMANKELLFQNEEKEKRAAELVRANEELVAFTYISSHDLQEPLRKIQTFAHLLLDKENHNLSERGKDYYGRIVSAAGRMRNLIEDLLAYSRTNITERKFEKIELSVITTEVMQELKEMIEEKHAIVETLSSCEINIIHFQFHQLMNNLVRNSLKFASPGTPPHIVISSRVVSGKSLKMKNLHADQLYCHISIKDNGIGFEPEFKERIFEVFQKLHSKEKYEGTGIGLAIVKKIVENHNGFIAASSKLGEGATFDIYIPHV